LPKEIKFSKHETYLFETPESLQTGDQLLDIFYEAPTHTEEMRSELSATLDDDNSFDENSIMSDREKETTATDLHLIKSTIDDPTLGIKLTIKKLSRDSKRLEQNSRKSRSNRRNSWSPHESNFEYIPLKQPQFVSIFAVFLTNFNVYSINLIEFLIPDFQNRAVPQRTIEPLVYYPSQWFVLTMSHRNNYSLKTNFKIKKSRKQLYLYSCDLLNVL